MNRAGEKNVRNRKSSQKEPPVEALAAGQPLIHGCVPQEPFSDPSLRFVFLCDWLLSHTGSQSCFLLLHPQRGLSPEMAKGGSLTVFPRLTVNPSIPAVLWWQRGAWGGGYIHCLGENDFLGSVSVTMNSDWGQ